MSPWVNLWFSWSKQDKLFRLHYNQEAKLCTQERYFYFIHTKAQKNVVTAAVKWSEGGGYNLDKKMKQPATGRMHRKWLHYDNGAILILQHPVKES